MIVVINHFEFRGLAMTLEEYKQQIEKNPDYSPGWEAIESCFSAIYGDQNRVIMLQILPPVRILVAINTLMVTAFTLL